VTLEKFTEESGLADFDETEKVLIYFAFYHLKKKAVGEFSAPDGATWVRDNRMGNGHVRDYSNFRLLFANRYILMVTKVVTIAKIKGSIISDRPSLTSLESMVRRGGLEPPRDCSR